MAGSKKQHNTKLTGERFYPDLEGGGVAEIEHTERYRLATRFVKESRLCLDAACGTGYGTAIIAEFAKKVVGVDIADDAITYARNHFLKPNVVFERMDLNEMRFPDDYFDCIVSFETLEHINDHENLLNQFRRILNPGGMLIISTPDINVSHRLPSRSPFHVHELRQEEFTSLLDKYFVIDKLFGQKIIESLDWLQRLTAKLVPFLQKLDFLKLRKILPGKIIKDYAVYAINPIEDYKIHELNLHYKNDKFVNLIAICHKKQEWHYALVIKKQINNR